MIQHQGTMEWGPHMDPTPMCLGVVSLLCSVSVRITPLKKMGLISTLHRYNNCTTPLHMGVDPTHWAPPHVRGCCVIVVVVL